MDRSFSRAGFVGPALMTVVIAVGAACGSAAEDGSDAGEMGDMPGMSAPAGGSMGDTMGGGMMETMRMHMEGMTGLPADSLAALLPTHRQMVANMLSQMNREMSDMNMAADASWTATVDSLRADLTSMPRMGADEIAGVMPAHLERVERLISMHGAMMRRMGM